MSFPTGSFHLGPDDATLTVHTGTAGPMAKAGHALELRVTAWSATLVIGEQAASTSLSLDVDTSSFRVIDGHGGPKALTDDDRGKILANIETKVLKGEPISFRSSSAAPAADGADGGLDISGQLTLLGHDGPARFTLALDDAGRLSARTEVVQSAFGLEPYSAMMGALKVRDEVVIEVDGQLSAAD